MVAPVYDPYSDCAHPRIIELAGNRDRLTKLSQPDRLDVLDYVTSPMRNFFPNRGQKEIIQSTAQKILVAGANKSGKTELGGHVFCYHMTGWYPDWFPEANKLKGKIRGCIVVPNFKEAAGAEIEPYLFNMIPQSLIDRRRCHKNEVGVTTKWHLKNGNTFTIMSCEQKPMAFETIVADFVWVNEPIPRDRYIALVKGFMVTHGKLMITATLLEHVWVWDEFIDSNDPDKRYFTMDISDNLEVNGGVLIQKDIDDFASGLDIDERDVRLHGRPQHLVGMIYNRVGLFQPDIHVQDLSGLDFRDSSKYALSVTLDPHDTTPHALVWRAVDKTGTCYYFDEGWIDGDYADMAEYIKAHEMAMGPVMQRTIDPNFGVKTYGNSKKTVIQELEAHKLYFVPGLDALEEGHIKVKSGLKYDPDKKLGMGNYPRIIIGRNCTHIIKSLSRYARTKAGKITEEWKHFCDCVRYDQMSNPKFVETKRAAPKPQYHQRRAQMSHAGKERRRRIPA